LKRKFIPKEIKSQIKVRKSLLKNIRKCVNAEEKAKWCKLYNKANNKVKSPLQNLNQRDFEQQVENKVKEHDIGKMWKKLNKFKHSTPRLKHEILR
jgi:hypothetical protein